MNKFLLIGLLTLPLTAMAENTGRTHINKAKIQQLMQQGQQVQACMANIDPKLMDEFKRKAKETDAEIKALCTAGKRDAAEARTKKFSDEIAQSKVMQETQKCTASMMADLGVEGRAQTDDQKASHVCDR